MKMKAREFMTKINEGVKRNALYQKVGRMLGKGHNIDAIKKRYKDIDDAYPGHLEKIVQALKDRNEIPGHLKRIKGSDVEEGMMDDEVKAILMKYPKELAKLKASEDLMDVYDTPLYQDLFAYFSNSGDMPYGTQKGRDGDPVQFIQDELDDMGVFESIKETTSAGSVAAVAMPLGAIQSRTGSKKKKKDTKTKESGLQRYTGIKKYGKKGFEALQKAGREGASEEQKGAIKDKYLKKKK